MRDAITKKPICVVDEPGTGTGAGPYIMVPVAQLDELRRLLEGHRVPFWVEEDAISLDGEPAVAVVDLGPEADPADVQRILDAVP